MDEFISRDVAKIRKFTLRVTSVENSVWGMWGCNRTQKLANKN